MQIPISKNWFGQEELDAVQQPLQDGWVVQGPCVEQFERSFCDYTQSSYSIACTSATAALHIAITALNLRPNDEVIVPGYTWIATPHVFN